MLRHTEGGGQATKCVYLSIFGSARDVGLGVGRGLQSTVNDAGAHHLDNGSQHGVLALKKLSFSSVFFKGVSGGFFKFLSQYKRHLQGFLAALAPLYLHMGLTNS